MASGGLAKDSAAFGEGGFVIVVRKNCIFVAVHKNCIFAAALKKFSASQARDKVMGCPGASPRDVTSHVRAFA